MAKKQPTVIPGTVKARVLSESPHGSVNSVVEVDAQVANDDDALDPSTEAVAYAESLVAITAP